VSRARISLASERAASVKRGREKEEGEKNKLNRALVLVSLSLSFSMRLAAVADTAILVRASSYGR